MRSGDHAETGGPGDLLGDGEGELQEAEGLDPSITVMEELLRSEPDNQTARDLAGRFLFSGDDVLKRVASLSGGERSRLALAKLVCSGANLVLLDEPSLGLSPKLTKEIFEIVVRINRERGTTILLVEQNANMALNAADYGYVLENGRIVMEDTCARLREKEDIKEFYLGMKEAGVRGERRWKKKKTWR